MAVPVGGESPGQFRIAPHDDHVLGVAILRRPGPVIAAGDDGRVGKTGMPAAASSGTRLDTPEKVCSLSAVTRTSTPRRRAAISALAIERLVKLYECTSTSLRADPIAATMSASTSAQGENAA